MGKLGRAHPVKLENKIYFCIFFVFHKNVLRSWENILTSFILKKIKTTKKTNDSQNSNKKFLMFMHIIYSIVNTFEHTINDMDGQQDMSPTWRRKHKILSHILIYI